MGVYVVALLYTWTTSAQNLKLVVTSTMNAGVIRYDSRDHSHIHGR
jgi:hypothetical protein